MTTSIIDEKTVVESLKLKLKDFEKQFKKASDKEEIKILKMYIEEMKEKLKVHQQNINKETGRVRETARTSMEKINKSSHSKKEKRLARENKKRAKNEKERKKYQNIFKKGIKSREKKQIKNKKKREKKNNSPQKTGHIEAEKRAKTALNKIIQ